MSLDDLDEFNWDGIAEYGEVEKLKNLIEDASSGFKRVIEAIKFAAIAHRDQLRKGTSIPYIIHPLMVAEILLEFGCTSPHLLIAAILHDTVEDTAFTAADIRKRFGEKVAEIVEALSEPDKTEAWENRKANTISRIKDAPVEVLWVECADKLDNIRAIHHDYDLIGEKLWERFNRPQEQQKWYYQSLAAALSLRKENEGIARIIEAFTKEVNEVFKRKKKG